MPAIVSRRSLFHSLLSHCFFSFPMASSSCSASTPYIASTNDEVEPASRPDHKYSQSSLKDEDSTDAGLFMVPVLEPQGAQVIIHPAEMPIAPSMRGAGRCNRSRRKRERNPIDREHRRIKRLLRNRVSAQQAREKKKEYVNDLELRAKKLQDKNTRLEEKISAIVNENSMLRKVLMNMRPKAEDHPVETLKHDLGRELTI